MISRFRENPEMSCAFIASRPAYLWGQWTCVTELTALTWFKAIFACFQVLRLLKSHVPLHSSSDMVLKLRSTVPIYALKTWAMLYTVKALLNIYIQPSVGGKRSRS